MSKIRFLKKSFSNGKFVKCEFCGNVIAEIINDDMVPSAENCHAAGKVPVPNLGWFCSQECAVKFEGKYDTTFYRTQDGKIDYYAK
jgi:hypothetical protein